MPVKTIVEAIKEVLQAENKALSIKDICKYIKERGLYSFNTDNPEHVVRNQLRRHCDNLELKMGSTTKYFTANTDGTYQLK